jgi:hypothetical protein
MILMRHAKSSWKHKGLADHERPLSKRGRKDAPLVVRSVLLHRLRDFDRSEIELRDGHDCERVASPGLWNWPTQRIVSKQRRDDALHVGSAFRVFQR